METVQVTSEAGALLEGKVAIVTGAARGLGYSHARQLVACGARVIISDIAGAEEAAAAIVATGGQAIGVEGDAADRAVAAELVARAVEAFGDLHILVNNAGLLRPASTLDLSEDDWDQMLRANLHATVTPSLAAIRYWKDRPDAAKRAIVNTSSGSGLSGTPGRAPYGAGKAGTALLTLIWSDELAPIGVRVNAIAPVARTNMTNQTEFIRGMMRKPEDGFDTYAPEHVSPVVAWLAADSCPLNGTVWNVRGGEIAQWLPWHMGEKITSETAWTVADVAERLPAAVVAPPAKGTLQMGATAAILSSANAEDPELR
jgi:NAD(P)-dependent dehydrogenase (short-subunit alcohol dehydrogenase family)